MASPRNSDGEKESRRILDRVARESEAGGGAFVRCKAGEMRDHLGAADVDRSDRIEHIGTRIGRILGFVLTIGLILWLVNFLVRGG